MGKKGKLIRHMGMTMTEERHRKWHEAQQEPASGGTAGAAPPGEPVNPFAIGGGFLAYCVRHGWLVQQGRGRNMKYYMTDAGREPLAEFGIMKC